MPSPHEQSETRLWCEYVRVTYYRLRAAESRAGIIGEEGDDGAEDLGGEMMQKALISCVSSLVHS